MLSIAAMTVQGIAMVIDEFYFHQKRGLGRWERIGHPIDTVFFILALWGALNADRLGSGGAWSLMLLSSLIVLKDEFEHKRLTPPAENLLHGLLFMVHPLVLIAVWIERASLGDWILIPPLLFLIYQVLFWLILGKGKWPGSTVSPTPRVHRLGAQGAIVSHDQAARSELSLKAHDLTIINNDVYEDMHSGWSDSAASPFRLLEAESRLKNQWVLGKLRSLQTALQKQSLRILDVGCGAGYLSNALAQVDEFTVIGLDASSLALEKARERDFTGRAQYVLGDAYMLDDQLGQFDAISVMDVLEHVSRPDLVIGQIAKRLKPGGLILFHTFNRNWISDLIVIKGMEWFVPETPKRLHVKELFIKPAELRKDLEAHGFSDTQIEGIRPVVFQKAMWTLLTRKEVEREFQFCLTKSLVVGYLGTARAKKCEKN